MKVGVVFPSRFEDPGEFLADARAMETAGVDSIWLQDQNDGLDPLLMLAAIAAVTSRLRLGLIPESPSPAGGGGQGGGFDQRQISTLQQLSRNRLVESSTESWQRVEVPADRPGAQPGRRCRRGCRRMAEALSTLPRPRVSGRGAAAGAGRAASSRS